MTFEIAEVAFKFGTKEFRFERVIGFAYWGVWITTKNVEDPRVKRKLIEESKALGATKKIIGSKLVQK